MAGRPVWLASLSRRNESSDIIPTGRWSGAQLRSAIKVLKALGLKGVGDERYERGFRMCATLCIHRGLSDEEIKNLPAHWHDTLRPRVLAGGPIEHLWRNELSIDTPSTQPCTNPKKKFFGPKIQEDLYLPIDCGLCVPCQAREALTRPENPMVKGP